jgi:hypothetical protein
VPGIYRLHRSIKDTYYQDSAVILEDAVMPIPREDFLQMIYSDINIATKFIHIITHNIKEKKTGSEYCLQLPSQTLATALVEIITKFNSGNNLCPLKFQGEITQYVGTATESLIRTPSDFKAENS